MSQETLEDNQQHQLLTANEVATILQISERHLRRLSQDGSMINPIRLGRSVRYCPNRLKEWINEMFTTHDYLSDETPLQKSAEFN